MQLDADPVHGPLGVEPRVAAEPVPGVGLDTGLHPPVREGGQLVDGGPAVEPAGLDVALCRVVAQDEGGVDHHAVHDARDAEAQDHPVRALVASAAGLPPVVDLTAGAHRLRREGRRRDLDQVLLLGVRLFVGGEDAAPERAGGEVDQMVVRLSRHAREHK
jgi:hypothetical protein